MVTEEQILLALLTMAFGLILLLLIHDVRNSPRLFKARRTIFKTAKAVNETVYLSISVILDFCWK